MILFTSYGVHSRFFVVLCTTISSVPGGSLGVLTDGYERVWGVSAVDRDVVLRTRLPWAVLRKRVTRTGDHAPAGGRETLDCRMPDPAACSGQEQCSARLIVVWRDHAATLDHNWWL